MANTCARGPLILGDFNLSISLDLSLVARTTHICMHFMRKGAGASNNSCVCVYLNIFLEISISISRSIYRWWPRNTLIYIRMHFMRKGAGASNNVCVHSIDDP